MLKRGIFVIFIAVAGKLSAHSRPDAEAGKTPAESLRPEQSELDWQLRAQQITIAAIGAGFIITSCFAWFMVRMRRQSAFQKEAIEFQAEALLRLNEELKHLNRSLENGIRERTAQLEMQNQKIAEYTFINAHKLRAPVASILGLINLFQQASVEEKDQIAGHLRKCGIRLDEMIHELTKSLEEAVVPAQDEGTPAIPNDSLSPRVSPLQP